MLYMFIRVFCNFHFTYEGYFVISGSIPSNLFISEDVIPQLRPHPSSQIRSTKQASFPQIHHLEQ